MITSSSDECGELLEHRGVQVLDTKRGPKSPKFPPKIGFLRGIFDIQLSNTSHTPTILFDGKLHSVVIGVQF